MIRVRRVVLPLLLIAAAVAHASPEPDGYWTGDVNAPTPSTLRGAKVVDAAQVSRLLKGGTAVIIDVSNAPRRPDNLAPGAPWMPAAHVGIPGALWIPGAGLGLVPVPVERFFRARLVAATGGDFSRAVVIYCHRRCWLSWNAAKRAISYGYRNVAWFREGIEGWRARGLSTAELKPAEPSAASPNAAPLSPRATPPPHASPSRSPSSSPHASPSPPDDDDSSETTTELAWRSNR